MRREQVSKFFLVMTGLLPFMLSAQSPQQTKLTEAGNKTLIESGTVNLKTGADAKMDASLRTADTLLLLTLSGSGVGTATIDASDEVVFVLDNDSSVTVKSTGFQGIESKDFVNSYRHDYAISRDALETLSRHNLRRVRKYAMTEHKDIYLDEKSAGNLRGLCASFLEELYRLRPLMVSSAAPAFPGGKEVFLAFLKRNLKLQSAAVEGPKQALVQFLVGADGSVSNIQILQSAGALYDAELLRILKRMPKWKPAVAGGRGVEAVVVQQVSFVPQGATVGVQF
jgi:TonB family protein